MDLTSTPPPACQVSTTTDSAAAAAGLAESAVTARLAACAQVGAPITSWYRWQGAVRSATEWPVVFKTSAARAGALMAHLRAAHGYQLPEIICTPITGGDPEYLAWLDEQSSAKDPSGGP